MTSHNWSGKANVEVGENFPATFVSWEDATEFCKKLTVTEHNGKLPAGESYRLPTEAEWEYACRAGTTTAYSFGDDESKLGQYAWWGGLDLESALKGVIKAGGGNAAREQYAHSVGLKKPNPWGLRDMHGNVWEWCSDWHGNALSGGTDPVGPKGGSYPVFRGGGWRDDPSICRSAIRNSRSPSARISYLGFRVARSQSAQ